MIVDLSHMRTVRVEEHQRFANDHNATSFLVSAKTKESFFLPFSQTAAECLGYDKKEETVAPTVVKATLAMPAGQATLPRQNMAKEMMEQDAKAQQACSLM